MVLAAYDMEMCDCDRFRCGGVCFWQLTIWRCVALTGFDAEMCDFDSLRCGDVCDFWVDVEKLAQSALGPAELGEGEAGRKLQQLSSKS